jgi:hypothetical protein
LGPATAPAAADSRKHKPIITIIEIRLFMANLLMVWLEAVSKPLHW